MAQRPERGGEYALSGAGLWLGRGGGNLAKPPTQPTAAPPRGTAAPPSDPRVGFTRAARRVEERPPQDAERQIQLPIGEVERGQEADDVCVGPRAHQEDAILLGGGDHIGG